MSDDLYTRNALIIEEMLCISGRPETFIMRFVREHTKRLAVVVAIVTMAPIVRPLAAGEINAFTEPYRDIDVAAAETGTIAELFIKEGDVVAAGQPLFRLDDDYLQASLKIAESGMNAQGKLQSAIAELRMHQERLEKLVGLRERNHASQQEVDRTRTQLEIAEANRVAVCDERQIRLLEHSRIAEQIRVRRTVSPINGTVTSIQKDVGEFVSANDPVVVKVVQLDPLLIVFSASFRAQNEIRQGESISILIGDDRREAIVEFVSPTIDAQSSTVRVKARLPNPEGRIRSGSPCRIQLSDNATDYPDRLPGIAPPSQNQSFSNFHKPAPSR